MTPEIRFVLLSMARSGTTMAIDLLKQHPDVYGHTEIFGRNNEGRAVDKAFVEAHGLDGRLDDQVAFLRKIHAFSPGPKCVGFKMWPSQAPEVCDVVLADAGIHKIIHERENYLASYSSNKLASLTGISHISSARKAEEAAQAERPKLPFDKADFMNVAQRRARQFKRMREKAEGPVFASTYRGVVENGIAPIYAFLGLAPFEPESRLKKVNSSNILSRFLPEHHDEIIATLDELGHPEWVSEN
jgi:hypothetical protein